MVANSEFSVKHAFVLEREQVRKICRLLQDRVAPPSISAKCADGIAREFPDINQLLEYENPRKRRIVALTFSSNTKDWTKRAQVSFAAHSWATVSVSISGAETSVLRLKDELGEVVDGTKPWYWRFARIDFFIAALIVWCVAGSLLGIYANHEGAPTVKQAVTLIYAFSVIGVVSAALGGLALLGWGLICLRDRYFPLALFRIGQEARRFETDDKVRWTIMIGFAVSLIASIVVSVWRG